MPPRNPNQTQMPMPGAPGQIDVSLTLLGSESKQLLEAFSSNIAGLTDSLKQVVKQQESILNTLGQILPSVGGVGGGAYTQAAGGSVPPRAPQGQGGDNSSRPNQGLRTQGTGVRQGQGRGRGDEDDIYIPRIGEFNSQDILNQLRHVAGVGTRAARWTTNQSANASSAMETLANFPAGQATARIGGQRFGFNVPFQTGPGTNTALRAQMLQGIASGASRVSGVIGQGLGALSGSMTGTGRVATTLNSMGGVLGGLSKAAPYLNAFTQTTGINPMPGAMVRQGTSMGLAPGGTNIGPFRIPGLDIQGPTNFNPFDAFGMSVSASPAMAEALHENKQALEYGMTPGGSTKWMRGAQESLKQLGWSGDNLKNMAGGWGALQASQQYGQGAIGSNQTIAPMIDQMIRFGSSSLGDFVGVLKQLPDAARAANLQIDASNQLLNQFAEAAKSQGVNYTQGLQTGAAIQTATGMAASTLQPAMTSPLIGGMLAAENGVMPGTTMQLGAGQNTQMTYQMVQQLWRGIYPQQVKLHGNTQLAKDQAAAIISPMVGGLSTQQIESMVTQDPKQIGQMAGISENLSRLQKNMQWVQSQEPGEGPKAKQVTKDLNTEMFKHQDVYAEAKAVGVKPNTSAWTQIFGTGDHPTDPMKAVQNLQDYIANKSKGNTQQNGNSPMQVIVGFTPQAQKWLQTSTGPTAKDNANAGMTNINAAAATAPNVNQAYSAGSSPGSMTPSGYPSH